MGIIKPLLIGGGLLLAKKLFSYGKELSDRLTYDFDSAQFNWKKTQLLTSELLVKLAVGNPLPVAGKIEFINVDLYFNEQVVASLRKDNLQATDAENFTIPANSAKHILPLAFSVSHIALGTQIFSALQNIFSSGGSLIERAKKALPKEYIAKGTMRLNGFTVPIDYTVKVDE